MKETLTIIESRLGISSSDPIFSSCASEFGLTELHDRGSFLAKLEASRGVSVYRIGPRFHETAEAVHYANLEIVPKLSALCRRR